MLQSWRKSSALLWFLAGVWILAQPLVAKEGLPEEKPCEEIFIGSGELKLPLPCDTPLADYEKILYRWMNDRNYTKLGWKKDRLVRDTGPLVLGADYGTHPAVRVYYSPEVYEWMNYYRRPHGTVDANDNDVPMELPRGAMIIKEMFPSPAARFNELLWTEYKDREDEWEALVQESVSSWAVMIRDGETLDGWFWASPALVSKSGKTPAEYEQAIAETVDRSHPPFHYPDSDHGLAPCLRCHAIADAQSTFSDPKNQTGEENLYFRVDNSWRDLPAQQRPVGGQTESELTAKVFHGNPSTNNVYRDTDILSQPLATPNPLFTETFALNASKRVPVADFSFPTQWTDHVPAGPDGAEQFITSDNCLGCHGGLGGAPFGLTMFLQTGPAYGDGYNISPFGEWRWSPMGLAGRDPAFYSQLATERQILQEDLSAEGVAQDEIHEIQDALVNTCMSCHGAMGQRQLLIDHQELFDIDYVYAHTAFTEADREKQEHYEYHKYGNLAREGISCAVCHHIDQPEGWFEDGQPRDLTDDEKEAIFLFQSTTGQFPYADPDKLIGPFDDVLETPMEQALGITPEYNAYIKDSRLCGSCHTINLPNVDCPKPENFCRNELGLDCPPTDHEAKRCQDMAVLNGSAVWQGERLEKRYGLDYATKLAKNYRHTIEQATYLEWKNSAFGADWKADSFITCQECHMPNSFHSLAKNADGTSQIAIDPLTSQIASIQDSNYPIAENALPQRDLFVPYREDYRRHELVGLNVFLVEMFNQFDPILGVDEADYMTGATNGDQLAIENMLVQARDDTVQLDLDLRPLDDKKLQVDVTVNSLVGHRFPSGVGFRRAWIELAVQDEMKGGEVVWISGATNDVGLIVDGLNSKEPGAPLNTEFFGDCRGKMEVEPPCQIVYQPHFDMEHPITSEDQVQIYEEVTINGKGEVTFSFIHRDQHLKDNRLLPVGWRADTRANFPNTVIREFMEATTPEGTEKDAHYTEGKTGTDVVRYEIDLPGTTTAENVSVRATMYYQSFQPYWFKRKFDISPDYPETQRLYYLASHLKTDKTVIDDWRLPLVSCEQGVDGKAVGCVSTDEVRRRIEQRAQEAKAKRRSSMSGDMNGR